MLIGDLWRSLAEFFRDDYRDPLTTPTEPCGRYACVMPDDYAAVLAEFRSSSMVARTEVVLAIDRAVIISESSAFYSPEQCRAVRVMAIYLETTLHLPVIHGP